MRVSDVIRVIGRQAAILVDPFSDLNPRSTAQKLSGWAAGRVSVFPAHRQVSASTHTSDPRRKLSRLGGMTRARAAPGRNTSGAAVAGPHIDLPLISLTGNAPTRSAKIGA